MFLRRLEPGAIFQVAIDLDLLPDQYELISCTDCRASVCKVSPPSSYDKESAGFCSSMSPNTEVEEVNDMTNGTTRNRKAKGKPPAATLLKELNENTIQGKIIKHIMNVSASMESLMDEFFMERHSVLTHLNVIARTSGIGYSVDGDVVSIVMPEGILDPFEL